MFPTADQHVDAKLTGLTEAQRGHYSRDERMSPELIAALRQYRHIGVSSILHMVEG
jgi:hypothetical protein